MEEQKKLYNLYALFGVSLILCVVPYVSAAILCIVFFTWLLIASYIIRGKAEDKSLVHNHTTFIIRTLWIGALISVITTLAASAYMLGTISYEPFQPCAEVIARQGINYLHEMSSEQLYEMISPCVDDFVAYNKQPLIIAVAIGAAPPLIYIAYRFVKGLSRIVKGYRVSNPRSWF